MTADTESPGQTEAALEAAIHAAALRAALDSADTDPVGEPDSMFDGNDDARLAWRMGWKAARDDLIRELRRVLRPTARDATSPPLAVTTSPTLLGDLRRIAGGDIDTVPDAAHAHRWADASLVVVGADAAAGCVDAGLPRRPRVVLAADRDRAGDEGVSVWDLARDLGAERVIFLPDPAAEVWLAGWLAVGEGGASSCPASGMAAPAWRG